MSALRLVGVEGGSFEPFAAGAWSYICAVRMEDFNINEVRIGKVLVDGSDCTDVLLGMLRGLNCDVVVLGGVTFAGFNVVDVRRLATMLRVPVIIYSATRPDSTSVLTALRAHFDDWEDRWSVIEKLGEVHEMVPKAGLSPVFFEVIGATSAWAAKVLRGAISLSKAPECVRVAGIIAKGLGWCTGP